MTEVRAGWLLYFSRHSLPIGIQSAVAKFTASPQLKPREKPAWNAWSGDALSEMVGRSNFPSLHTPLPSPPLPSPLHTSPPHSPPLPSPPPPCSDTHLWKGNDKGPRFLHEAHDAHALRHERERRDHRGERVHQVWLLLEALYLEVAQHGLELARVVAGHTVPHLFRAVVEVLQRGGEGGGEEGSQS